MYSKTLIWALFVMLFLCHMWGKCVPKLPGKGLHKISVNIAPRHTWEIIFSAKTILYVLLR